MINGRLEWIDDIQACPFTNKGYLLFPLFQVVQPDFSFVLTQLKPSFIWQHSERHISSRRHASDKWIDGFSSCLDWEKLSWAVAWSVMGCLIRNRLGLGGNNRNLSEPRRIKSKKMSVPKRKCPIALIISRSLWVLSEICWKASSHAFWSRLETKIQWQRTEFEMLFSLPILFTVARCWRELVFGSCFDVAHRKLCIVFLHC